MKIQPSEGQRNTFVVTLGAGELITESGKAVPYPFYLGTFTIRSGKAPRLNVWTPAASKPRGYKLAARRKLEEIAQEFDAGRIVAEAPTEREAPAVHPPRFAEATDRAAAVAAARQARGDNLTQEGYQRASQIVARRQAALRDNGEDERNTSAWRDALREGYELYRMASFAGLEHFPAPGVALFNTDRGY
jgi:hypothetical protein